jgi:hypothetical protein
MSLPDAFVRSAAARLDSPDVTGIALTGSHARGEGSTHSDVDLRIYVATLPENELERYVLRYCSGRLVSLTYVSIQDELAAACRPWEAIWTIPSLRQMQILLDKSGELAKLRRLAEDFKWEKLQPAADRYLVEQLMGYAEEAHKILNGLARDEEATVLYAVWGILKGLAGAVATERGLFIESDNRYLDAVQDAMGRASEWTRAFRIALGADCGPTQVAPYKIRGAAALALYRHTALLFKSISYGKHQEVIDRTVQDIEDAGYL